MPCWGCGYVKRVSYDLKCEMKRRRTMRRRMKHATNTKDWTVLSEEGECRSEGMGGAYEESTVE